ncbi:unnamed protein product [Gongylonema pulchrum]|uniref:Glycosyl hydrolase n=1 Tax=Gongylonema pulchrum TaxID=637853 RepID=A0A183EH09_9BILA|nr:unnamed protein product [Gongylonema pulchrum]
MLEIQFFSGPSPEQVIRQYHQFIGLPFLPAYWSFGFQEITTGPGPHLIYRTIGGMLEIQFFSGPSPEQVIRQYHQFIGLPFLPAYWSFGFQLSRYGHKTLDDLITTVNRNLNAGVPVEVVHADIDYMDRYKDFTLKQIVMTHNLIVFAALKKYKY